MPAPPLPRSQSASASPGVTAAMRLRLRAASGIRRHPQLLLVLYCLLLWLPGFFTLPPSDRDESRFAEATRQMVETGDYVRILNGTEARNRKPIGIYWLQAPFALAARAGGLASANPIWPYRMPSLLGGIVAVLVTYRLGRRFGFDARAALLSAAMLAASVVLSAETHFAKTDAALLAATSLSMASLAQAYLAPQRLRRSQAVVFWLALGSGILIKGPVTPMIVGLTAASLAFADRRVRWLAALRPAFGVPLLAAVVVPWFVAIGRATHGAFFAQSLGSDLGGKLAGGDDAHGAPPGLHLLLLPLLAFPASAPILRALPDAWRSRADAVSRFLLAWIVPSWLVLEAVPTKLPHYALPLYPALCLLGARALCDRTRWPGPLWFSRFASVSALIAGLLIGSGAALLPFALHAPAWLGLPALLAAVLVALLAARAPMAALCAMPLLTFALLQVELPALAPLWVTPRVVAAWHAACAQHRCGDPPAPLGAVGYSEPSLMFLAGPRTRFFYDGADGARAWAAGEISAVVVDGPALPAFTREADRLGLTPRAAATIAGIDYSRGRRVMLSLFAGRTLR